MDGNASYKNAGMKDPGFLKKLSLWKNLYSEEDMQAAIPESSLMKESIQQARREWMSAVANFDQAEEEDMIDYYIYRIKACQVRYNYLLKKAKEMGLREDSHIV